MADHCCLASRENAEGPIATLVMAAVRCDCVRAGAPARRGVVCRPAFRLRTACRFARLRDEGFQHLNRAPVLIAWIGRNRLLA